MKSKLLIAIVGLALVAGIAYAANVAYDENVYGNTNAAGTVVSSTVDSISIPASGSNVAISNWFPLVVPAYSQTQGKMIDVSPDQYEWSFLLNTVNSSKYVRVNVFLETSEDKSYMSMDSLKVAEIVETLTAVDAMRRFTVNMPRTDFRENVPRARYGRLIFACPTNEAYASSVHKIRYRGLLTEYSP